MPTVSWKSAALVLLSLPALSSCCLLQQLHYHPQVKDIVYGKGSGDEGMINFMDSFSSGPSIKVLIDGKPVGEVSPGTEYSYPVKRKRHFVTFQTADGCQVFPAVPTPVNLGPSPKPGEATVTLGLSGR